MSKIAIRKHLNAHQVFMKQQVLKTIGKDCLKVLSWIGIAIVMIVCGFFYFIKSCLGAK